MTLNRSPKPVKSAFVLFVLICLSFSATAFARKKRGVSSQRKKVTRSEKGRRTSARRGRTTAKATRRGRSRRLSASEIRRQRQMVAREQTAAIKALERRLRRPLTKRERAAELRRVNARHRRGLEEARRRAEAARLAAIARQRAIDQAMRSEVQNLIARDETSGEDPEVRRAAVNALGNHAGTVVVMDPLTGRIYSVVNQEWALRRGFKPCSTIKLVTGVAGLAEDAIPAAELTTVSDRMDLTSALAHSNNPYFEQVGSRIGFDKMVGYSRQLGLGEKTGANYPIEYSGRVPEMKPGFVVRRMFSYADGFEVTPLQLGTLVSAMANGGKLLVPQIPRTSKEEAEFTPKVRRHLDIDNDVWQRMVPGMVGAVNYGSGRRAYDSTQTVAGKTGTCIGQDGWVGLFASYAPLANPRLAVVVIAEGSDARQHFPAAVAGEIYRELNHRFGTPTNLQIATTVDDEEKDEADAEAAENGETATAEELEMGASKAATATNEPTSLRSAGKTPAPRNTVKRVLMPIEKKNSDTPTTDDKTKPAINQKGAGQVVSPADQRPRRASQP